MSLRILLLLALVSTAVPAQRNARNPGNANPNANRDPFGNQRAGNQRAGGGQQRDMRAPSRFDALAAKLELDKDQKKVVRQTFEQFSKEAEPLRQETTRANHAIYEALKAGKSEQEINEMVDKQSALYARMAALEIRAFAAMFKQLDGGQQKRAEEVMPRMAGFFQTKKWSSPE